MWKKHNPPIDYEDDPDGVRSGIKLRSDRYVERKYRCLKCGCVWKQPITFTVSCPDCDDV